MLWIAASVVCSVVVSVLLKLLPRWQVDVRQAIAGNYIVAFVLTVALLRPDPQLLGLPIAHPAWRVLVALGILLPSMFAVLARAVRTAGVARADAAQRLSLVLPLAAAFTIFGQVLTWQVGIGVVLGLVAIAGIVARRRAGADDGGMRHGGRAWLAVVFVGMGIIDILFKRVAQLTGVPFADVLFAAFALAAILSLLAIAWLYWRQRALWRWRHAGGALALGAFNFGNILFYIQAHRHLAGNPALVFSAMNIGVIVISTLVGVWAFREHLGRANRAGLVLAVIAVIVLAVRW